MDSRPPKHPVQQVLESPLVRHTMHSGSPEDLRRVLHQEIEHRPDFVCTPENARQLWSVVQHALPGGIDDPSGNYNRRRVVARALILHGALTALPESVRGRWRDILTIQTAAPATAVLEHNYPEPERLDAHAQLLEDRLFEYQMPNPVTDAARGGEDAANRDRSDHFNNAAGSQAGFVSLIRMLLSKR